MKDVNGVLTRLSVSPFRSRFRLEGKELGQLKAKGIDTIMNEAQGFIKTRLAPPFSPGTMASKPPGGSIRSLLRSMRIATCCRKCLAKWHDTRRAMN